MKKINIVKSNREFNEVINKGIKHKNTIFYLYILNARIIPISSNVFYSYKQNTHISKSAN